MSQNANSRLSAVRSRPAAWTYIPARIKPLRPQRSLKGPVATWRMPHVAGYTALRIPIRSTLRPNDPKNSGKCPSSYHR
jgi:hypothetical protein